MDYKGYFIEDQSLNGVKVVVYKYYDEKGLIVGSVVLSDCDCHGTNFRAHSNFYCINLKKNKCSK